MVDASVVVESIAGLGLQDSRLSGFALSTQRLKP